MMARLESMENNEGRGQPSSSGAGGEGDGGNNSKGGSKKSTARGEDKGQGLVLYLPYICLLLKLPTYLLHILLWHIIMKHSFHSLAHPPSHPFDDNHNTSFHLSYHIFSAFLSYPNTSFHLSYHIFSAFLSYPNTSFHLSYHIFSAFLSYPNTSFHLSSHHQTLTNNTKLSIHTIRPPTHTGKKSGALSRSSSAPGKGSDKGNSRGGGRTDGMAPPSGGDESSPQEDDDEENDENDENDEKVFD